jgi:hypothetical protein
VRAKVKDDMANGRSYSAVLEDGKEYIAAYNQAYTALSRKVWPAKMNSIKQIS